MDSFSIAGSVLRSEILGSLKMRSYLSGMPELKLGLNDKLLFEGTGRASGKVNPKPFVSWPPLDSAKQTRPSTLGLGLLT